MSPCHEVGEGEREHRSVRAHSGLSPFPCTGTHELHTRHPPYCRGLSHCFHPVLVQVPNSAKPNRGAWTTAGVNGEHGVHGAGGQGALWSICLRKNDNRVRSHHVSTSDPSISLGLFPSKARLQTFVCLRRELSELGVLCAEKKKPLHREAAPFVAAGSHEAGIVDSPDWEPAPHRSGTLRRTRHRNADLRPRPRPPKGKAGVASGKSLFIEMPAGSLRQRGRSM